MCLVVRIMYEGLWEKVQRLWKSELSSCGESLDRSVNSKRGIL